MYIRYTFPIMLSWWHYIIIFAAALAGTVVFTPLVRSLAIKYGVVDKPGPRRVNKEPIPRLGGVGMFMGLAIGILLEIALESAHVFPPGLVSVIGLKHQIIGICVGVVFILLVGVVDDIWSLPPAAKFAGQIIAACIIAYSGTLLSNFKLPFTDQVVRLGDWSYLITVVYLVCFANVINLIDGLDGLAAGISGIAALSLFALTVGLARNDASLLAVLLAGACIGFLFYNFHPASIFMGDSGSLMLGMLLGTISLVGATRFSSVTALAVPVVIAGVPVIDTFSAIIRRLRGHQPISAADAGHIHHRLLRHGFSQRKSVLLIYAWTALLSLGGAVIWNVGGALKYVVLVVMLAVSAVIIWKLGLFGPVLQHHYYPDSADSNGEVGEQSIADVAEQNEPAAHSAQEAHHGK